MKDITKNEISAILCIFKSPEIEYNANKLSKVIGISAMGALKILKRLEKEEILIPSELGRAIFYMLNFNNPYVKNYLKFLLRRESENPPNIESKIWVKDIREEIKSADAAIIFGSVLTKGKEARDIDVIFITDKRRFGKLNKEVKELNQRHTKKIHPIFQTLEDIKNNIKQKHKPVLSAIKGIVVFGEEKVIEALER